MVRLRFRDSAKVRVRKSFIVNIRIRKRGTSKVSAI